MKDTRRLQNLNLTTIQDMAQEFDNGYADNRLFIAMDFSSFGDRFLVTGQPYLLGEGRIMRILSGSASAFINLEHHLFSPNMCVIAPPHSVVEIEKRSSDFQMQAFSFTQLPEEEELRRCISLQLTPSDWQLTDSYFHLIWQESKCSPLNMYVIRHLQSALLARLLEKSRSSENLILARQNTAQLKLFHRFSRLLDQYGAREHAVRFYADSLGITPNYLGSVIKSVSGMSTLDWISRNLIMRAKIMLKYSDLPVWEIAEELNFPNPSTFSKYFRRETGMTPLGYRKA